ncbi:MAG: hypothetical protein LBG28_06950 [Tannerella sp.]|nr:hypothetical protein [Tannerella sp.]
MIKLSVTKITWEKRICKKNEKKTLYVRSLKQAYTMYPDYSTLRVRKDEAGDMFARTVTGWPATTGTGLRHEGAGDGCHCFWLTIYAIKARMGLSPYSCRPCRRANQKWERHHVVPIKAKTKSKQKH